MPKKERNKVPRSTPSKKEEISTHVMTGPVTNVLSEVRSLLSHPAVKYLSGGLAVAILTRTAKNLSEKYPEISEFISDNLGMLQDKLEEYKTYLHAEKAKH